ncbi:hypothetical protein FA15DRAFT_710884 [Coprinopsis marcescibilis]|uniref:Uncharacterized protein n=1 Tax=Coprinopsis marcescibilis TaxID=230819 RepID=A0A5C3KBY6_COPMA|nr:hypothetical protein FA15DRAFT_710884 [Coprinopsis marcescibilis]
MKLIKAYCLPGQNLIFFSIQAIPVPSPFAMLLSGNSNTDDNNTAKWKQQSQPSTSSAPLPGNTGNQQQQPFKKKCRGQKVKAHIAAAQLAAAAYSSITPDDSTMDIDTPMLPIPQNPPQPQQAIHSTLEISKGSKVVMHYACTDMPSHTYSQGATACKWVDQLIGKETQSPYLAYQSA